MKQQEIKIQDLRTELTYLRKKYPKTVEKYYHQPEIEKLSPKAKIEALNHIIDKINLLIIIKIIEKGLNDDNVDEHSLNLNNVGITRIPVVLFQIEKYKLFFEKLKSLHCDNNFIKTLRLSNLPALEALDCDNNVLMSVILKNLPRFKDIVCRFNPLEKLDLRSVPSVTGVNCSDNRLQVLDLRGLKQLEKVICNDNLLQKLIVEGQIIDLNCASNRLKRLKIDDLEALILPEKPDDDSDEGLQLKGNNLSVIPRNLRHKFGKDWADKALSSQNKQASPVTDMPFNLEDFLDKTYKRSVELDASLISESRCGYSSDVLYEAKSPRLIAYLNLNEANRRVDETQLEEEAIPSPSAAEKMDEDKHKSPLRISSSDNF